MTIEQIEEISSYVIESGENSNGKYYKFSNGLMICTHNVNNIECETNSFVDGGVTLYREIGSDTIWNYPDEFISKPDVFATISFGGLYKVAIIRKYNTTSTKTNIQTIAFSDFNTISEKTYTAIGRWK